MKISFAGTVLYIIYNIMISKNHIYIYYLPAIRYNYTYLNLDADVMFVLVCLFVLCDHKC